MFSGGRERVHLERRGEVSILYIQIQVRLKVQIKKTYNTEPQVIIFLIMLLLTQTVLLTNIPEYLYLFHFLTLCSHYIG